MQREDRLEQLLLRWQELRQLGQDVSPQALCADCPELAEALLHKTEAISYWETFLGMRCDTGRPASSPPADCPATLDGDSPEPSETATGNEVARSIP